MYTFRFIHELHSFIFPAESKRTEDGYGMSRSSFASFHLTGIKPSSGKMMQSSVDRLFENDGDVFLSSNFSEFQVIIFNLFWILRWFFK